MINIQPTSPTVGIYKITSPSNKIYIGQSIDIENRQLTYEKHFHTQCKNQIKLYRSLLKYEYEQHVFEILEECPESYLDELETWWKLFYNSVEDGLNHSYYDYSPMRGRKHNKETINKISQAHIGKKQSKNTIESRVIKLKGQKRSKESKQKMSISALSLNKNLSEEHKSKLKNLHKNNTYRVGKKHSEESKQKMRKPKTKEHILKLHGRKYTEEQKLKMSLLKIGKPSNRCKPVLQYDLNNFIFIKIR